MDNSNSSRIEQLRSLAICTTFQWRRLYVIDDEGDFLQISHQYALDMVLERFVMLAGLLAAKLELYRRSEAEPVPEPAVVPVPEPPRSFADIMKAASSLAEKVEVLASFDVYKLLELRRRYEAESAEPADSDECEPADSETETEDSEAEDSEAESAWSPWVSVPELNMSFRHYKVPESAVPVPESAVEPAVPESAAPKSAAPKPAAPAGEYLRAGEAGENILLMCKEIGFPDTIVKTSDAELMIMVRSFEADKVQAKASFLGSLSNFVRIRGARSLDSIYERNGQEWVDFCNDVAIYYAARYVLTGKQVPLICEPPPRIKIQRQSRRNPRG